MYRRQASTILWRRRAYQNLSRCQITPLRSYAETKSTDPSDSHGSHGTSHAAPASESLGRGFYLTIAIIASSLALYKFSRSSDDGNEPLLTRIIHKYDSIQDSFRREGNLQVQYLQTAAQDRHMWQYTEKGQQINLRFPEVFDTGCPTNVPAGSQAKLDVLYEHYDRQREEADQIRLQRQQRRETNERRWRETKEEEGRSTLLGSIASIFVSKGRGDETK